MAKGPHGSFRTFSQALKTKNVILKIFKDQMSTGIVWVAWTSRNIFKILNSNPMKRNFHPMKKYKYIFKDQTDINYKFHLLNDIFYPI